MPSTEILVESRFHHLPHVVSARATDATVLMDRKRGTYFTLNEVGGRVWELAGSGAAVSEIVERLLAEYDVPRSQLEQDVSATVKQFVEDRLLGEGIAVPIEPTPQPLARAGRKAGELTVPSVLWCGLLIGWFKLLLRLRGFLGTLDWIRDRVELLQATDEVALETVKAFEHAVAMAAALYPGRAKCLERSLTLYFLLRRRAVAARYCQGVQPYPFEAHAWIEYRSEVVNDVPEHASFFSRLPEQLP